MKILKSLLILVLVSVQLLSRDKVTVYLCVSSEGAYSIHFRKDACPPCVEVRAGESITCEHVVTPEESIPHRCNKSLRGRPAQRALAAVASPKSCDCEHFPVVMVLQQPRGTHRHSTAGDVQRGLAVSITLTTSLFELHSERQSQYLRSVSLPCEKLSLMVLSTVVIRT